MLLRRRQAIEPRQGRPAQTLTGFSPARACDISLDTSSSARPSRAGRRRSACGADTAATDALANRALIDTAKPATVLVAAGEVGATSAAFKRLRRRVLGFSPGPVRLDLSAIGAPGLSQVAVLVRLTEEARERGIQLELTGLSDGLAHALQQASESLLSEAAARDPVEPLLERVGEQTLTLAAAWKGWQDFVGQALSAILVDPFIGRPWKWDAIVEQMDLMGVRGAGIVVFISLLVGTVLALNGAIQLRQFGAAIFIANLVGVSMTREMGPLITAVIVAGRSGSAIAAELGTMKVTEEIDAMKTMGLAPNRFLLAPRIIALLVMLPCLTVLSDIFGIAGGYLVGTAGMGLGSSNYIRQTSQALFINDIVTGLIKSAVFAFLIGLVSCYEGLRVSGGAAGVGTATTRAVVTSIIAAIAADAVFTLIFYLTD